MSRLTVVMFAFAMVCLGGWYTVDISALPSAKRSLDNTAEAIEQPNAVPIFLGSNDVPRKDFGGPNDAIEKFLSGKGDEVIVGRLYR
jgi:hypothetical protein